MAIHVCHCWAPEAPATVDRLRPVPGLAAPSEKVLVLRLIIVRREAQVRTRNGKPATNLFDARFALMAGQFLDYARDPAWRDQARRILIAAYSHLRSVLACTR